MLYSFFAFLSLLTGLKLLASDLNLLETLFGVSREQSALKRVLSLLQELEETLLAGMIPPADRWASLRALPAPWSALAGESLENLRSKGSPLVPTLKRLRSMVESHHEALSEAKSRSAQSLGQAWMCAGLVPAFGSALYLLLPGVEGHEGIWIAGCLGALLLAGSGALWMLKMAEAARWAGLPTAKQTWPLATQCAGERFLALIRSGTPADLSYAQACQLLSTEAPGLAVEWGASVWRSAPDATEKRKLSPAERLMIETGEALRKAVQVSLMEGRPCLERAETALSSFRHDLKSQIERELLLLGNRTLKPLFLCVAPALGSLLALGLWLSWEQAVGGMG